MKKGYINCNIWRNPATAFATSGEYIIKVGTNQEIEELLCGEDAEIIDLKGMFVIPGFVDSHMHLAELGMYLSNVVLDDCHSNEEVITKIKEKLATTKAGEWIIGRGYNEESFPDHQKPTRQMLDEISMEVPIALTRACGHVLSANTAALKAAGITEHTKIEGGNIDYENGFVEENALNNIHNAYPQPDEEKIKEYIRIGASYANQFGVTTVGSDDFLAVAHDYKPVLRAFESLAYKQDMTVRVNEQCEFNNPKEFSKFLDDGYTFDVGDDYFRIGPLKLITDGSLGARTAYMKNAYADDPTTKGISSLEEDVIETYVRLANQFNMPTIAHAIGDAALDNVLHVYKDTVLEGNPLHHGIVHCQIMRPDQIKQVLEQKLACYFQSIFIDYDAQILESRVGKELASASYPYKTLLEGTLASNGSDAPVEMPNVLKGIECAVTRKSISYDACMNEEECLTVDEAIASFTINGAKMLFMDHCIGAIQEGYYADFVVLEKDIRTIPVSSIHQTKVMLTVMDGNTVYSND